MFYFCGTIPETSALIAIKMSGVGVCPDQCLRFVFQGLGVALALITMHRVALYAYQVNTSQAKSAAFGCIARPAVFAIQQGVCE